MQHEKLRKFRETSVKNYGVEHLQTEEIQQKMRIHVSRSTVWNIMQTEEITEIKGGFGEVRCGKSFSV